MGKSGTHTNLVEFTATAPAARPLNDFATEHVGDDLVIFDGETLQYHTLNGAAQTIWRACDGVSTIETIAASAELPIEVVETTIAELGEASLLQTSASTWSVPMNRRRAAKLIAAGVVGLPVVLSITAPEASAQVSPVICTWEDSNQSCNYAMGTMCHVGDPYNVDFYCCHRTTNGVLQTAWATPATALCEQGWDCGQGCPQGRGVNNAAIDDVEYIDDSVSVASVEDDPYLGDEDGNVDVNAIQADSVEQVVETDDVPATDVPIDDTSGTDASTDSSGGDSEPVDTSSSGEEAPTEVANG